MPTLEQLLRRPDALEAVKEDVAALIRAIVVGQGGLKGRALRSGLKTMESAHPGFLESSVSRMLPVFAETLEAHYERGLSEGDARGYFANKQDVIADDLLAITDGLAASSERRWVASAYRVLRPQARGHVVEGLPQLADLLAKHLG